MRLVFLGPPGAGKGTQAQWLGRRFGLAHLSTGDVFREAIAAGTPVGKQAGPFLSRGELVPDNLTVAMVVERLQHADCAGGYVLDGFPRTHGQAEALDQRLAEEGSRLHAVLSLEVDEQELLARLSGRRVCSNAQCSAVYHVVNHPPREAGHCDKCHAALEQRNDDRPETVLRRLEVYREQTVELVDYYRQHGLLHEIDGIGSVQDVHERLEQVVGELDES